MNTQGNIYSYSIMLFRKEGENMYNYMEALKTDITEYISDNEYYLEGYDRNELEEHLNDLLWTCDNVTGNGSGSYTFSREDAKEYIEEDGLDYLREAAHEFDCGNDILEHFLDLIKSIVKNDTDLFSDERIMIYSFGY